MIFDIIVNLILFIVLYIILLIIIWSIGIKIFYKRTTGILVLKRWGNVIGTIPNISVIRYKIKGISEFKKDCEIFFNSLDKGTYKTYTHALFKKEIIKRCGNENVTILNQRKKGMFLEYLFVANIKKGRNKHTYYEIEFKIK